MSSLPERPDLRQLRRQARELLRAAGAADEAALRRLAAYGVPIKLSGAQLTIAREHGLPNWAALRSLVQQRRTTSPAADGYILRRVGDVEDLMTVYDLIGAQHPRQLSHLDHRFGALARRLPDDRPMMLAVEAGGVLVAGGLATRQDDTTRSAGLFVGVAAPHRGRGLGRLMVGVIEREALALGLSELGLGGATEAERAFYRALGYAGRRSYFHKGLTPAGRIRQHRVERWLAERPDLDRGVTVVPTPDGRLELALPPPRRAG
ncbi:MAG TPA: GNAT family N-acetyltransferase [Acidimicrobiales bacterium]|nr:GNAT family N-acetyltransferase [Acidimicrobiales bacterium]